MKHQILVTISDNVSAKALYKFLNDSVIKGDDILYTGGSGYCVPKTTIKEIKYICSQKVDYRELI